MWIGDTNYGQVDLRKITIKAAGQATYDVTLDLVFNFDGLPFKRERRSITFRCSYEGLKFMVPIWTKPDVVTFPAEWKVPSANPHWSDDEVREFVSTHLDLSAYSDIKIDQSEGATYFEALP